MKNKILMFLLILVVVILALGLIMILNKQKNRNNSDMPSTSKSKIEKNDINMIAIQVNNEILKVKLENNLSATSFLEKLKNGDITVQTQDYNNFEKVGNLGFSLPTNDTNLTTEAGDLILYQGNKITLYYDTNTWHFTKLGKVQDVSQEELKSILGTGDVTMVFSLTNIN